MTIKIVCNKFYENHCYNFLCEQNKHLNREALNKIMGRLKWKFC